MLTVIEPVRSTKPETTRALHDLLRRAEGEYVELPGLNLTAAQAARLWGLSHTTCGLVLMTLVQSGILKRTAGGTYIRA
jgi:hypothetical protein